MSFIEKTFKNIDIIELNRKLDEYLEKEAAINKKLFPDIEFNIEGIIEKNSFNFSEDKFFQTESSSRESKFLSNTSNDFSSSFKFFVISNTFIYDFEYLLLENSLNLNRKLHLLSIDFFSITPDFKKLLIHVNNIIDRGGNIVINNNKSLHIVFCLCNIFFYSYCTTKNLIVIPKFFYFLELSKKISTFEKMKELYNKFSKDIFNKIGEIISYDKNENLVKIVPLSKIEYKFTDSKNDKLLLITNKKIIEISNENLDITEINIFSLSKMKKIDDFTRSNKFQIFYEDSSSHQYSSINSRILICIIKTLHSNECLSELEVIRLD